MAYQRLNLTDHVDNWTAAHVAHIEDGIEANEKALEDKQPKGEYLTEHQPIKTVNGQSLVGEGDVKIEMGPSVAVDSEINPASNNPLSNKAICENLLVIGEITTTVPGEQEEQPATESENLLVGVEWTNGYYVENTDGEIKELVGHSISGKIPVVAGETYVLYTDLAKPGSVYDADDNFLVSFQGVNGGFAEIELVMPATASHVIITVKNANSDKYWLKGASAGGDTGGSPPSEIVTVTEKYPLSYWTGKKFGFIGDSITYGNYVTTNNEVVRMDEPYPVIMQKVLGLAAITVDGRGGSCVSNIGGTGVSFADRVALMDADCDAVVIFGGVNDSNQGVTIGTTEDTDDTVSFCGALDKLCNELIARYTQKTIFFVTPLPSTRNTAGLQNYRDAIVEVCRGKYGITVIDGADLGFPAISSAFRATMMCDGIHPTPDGHVQLGKALARRVNSL